MSSRLLTHSRLLIAALVLAFAWAGPGGGTSHAQDLPSWAEPQEQSRQSTQPRERQRQRPQIEDRRKSAPDRSSSRVEPRMGQGGNQPGGFRTNNEGGGVVDNCSKCSGKFDVCCSTGDDKIQCRKNKSQCENRGGTVVPIGGPWAPFWTGMLIVSGVALGVYRLSEENGEARLLGGSSLATWTRTLIVVGLLIGGTTASSAHGFQAASTCASTLPPILPWGSYWIGMVLAAGLLGAAGRLYTQSSTARGQT